MSLDVFGLWRSRGPAPRGHGTGRYLEVVRRKLFVLLVCELAFVCLQSPAYTCVNPAAYVLRQITAHISPSMHYYRGGYITASEWWRATFIA